VRVDDPFRFAETVLGRNNGWSEQRVKKMIGGKERYIYLPKPLPVYLEYFTAFVNEAGELQLRDDVYGYSRRVKAALGLQG
jgi:murein L,D-transpeptidase YcbB/YkuD